MHGQRSLSMRGNIRRRRWARRNWWVNPDSGPGARVGPPHARGARDPGGFTGEGAKTVIPARAVAKISMRLVADQRHEEAAEQLKAAVKAVCPKGVTAEVQVLHWAEPSLTNPDNPYIHAAAEAMKQIFGKDTVSSGQAGRFRSLDHSTSTWDCRA